MPMRYNNALKFLKNTSFYMVTKNQIKLISSLQRKKSREESGLFVAEGFKVISEFLNAGFTVEYLFSTQENLFPKNLGVILISEAELKKISFLTTPNVCLAVFKLVQSSQLTINSSYSQKPNTQNLTPHFTVFILLVLKKESSIGLSNSIAVIPLTGANAHSVSGLIPTAYEPHDVTFSADGSLSKAARSSLVLAPAPGSGAAAK